MTVLNNSNLQEQGHETIFEIMMDTQIWIFNSVFKAEMVKDIDKAGKLIKKGGNRRFKKKSKLNSLSIE